jgi:hypothetical protein
MIKNDLRAQPWKTWLAPLALVLAACGANVSSDDKPQAAAGSEYPQPQSRIQADRQLQALVDTATADLRKRLGDAEKDAEIKVVRAARVTWRTAALGCPQPDRGYAQVLTPGALVVLRAGGSDYQYHSTPAGPPFLCEPPGRIETPAPSGSSLDPT